MIGRRVFLKDILLASAALSPYSLCPTQNFGKNINKAYWLNRNYAVAWLNALEPITSLAEHTLMSWWLLDQLSTNATLRSLTSLIQSHARLFLDRAQSNVPGAASTQYHILADYCPTLVLGSLLVERNLSVKLDGKEWLLALVTFLDILEEGFQSHGLSHYGPGKNLLILKGLYAARIVRKRLFPRAVHEAQRCKLAFDRQLRFLNSEYGTKAIPGEAVGGYRLYADPFSLSSLALYSFIQLETGMNFVRLQRLSWVEGVKNPYLTQGTAFSGLVASGDDLDFIHVPGYLISTRSRSVTQARSRLTSLAKFTHNTPLPEKLHRDGDRTLADKSSPLAAGLFTAMIQRFAKP